MSLSPMILTTTLLTLSLSACSTAKVTVESTDSVVGTAQLTLNPTFVDFGVVSAGMGGSAAVVEMTNTGDAELKILGFGLDNPGGPFTVSDAGASTLAPGESTGAILTFDPDDAGSFAANLSVSSSDPAGVSQVVLVGEAADGGVVLAPSSFDFGTLSMGCTGSVDVAVQNVGGSAITVNAVTLSGADGELTVGEGAPLPWTLAAGAFETVTVNYTPTLQHVVFGTLTVNTSSTTTSTVTGAYFGAAQAEPTANDHFSTPDGVVDLVVFVDKSSSMQDSSYVSRFRISMIALYDSLVALDADFQIAVLTDDDGCVNGRENFVTSEMSRTEAQSTLSVMFDTSYYGGELAEAGFSVLSAALSDDATGDRGCNRGLIRSTGALALIGVSDEDEQSGGDAGSWVTGFTGLKSDPARVHISAITGEIPDGCQEAAPGVVWSDVAQLTGGAVYSICGGADEWTASVAAIAEAGTGLTSAYTLSSEPDVSTLSVSIDGTLTTAWTYDTASRSLVFTEAAGLTWNQSIDVQYDIAQSCDD